MELFTVVIVLIISIAFFVLKVGDVTKKNILFRFIHKIESGRRMFSEPKIVTVGGGTGLSTLLSGLKIYTRNITAIVTVTDEGGSSGRLRQEWGMLPPGDIRNCIVALAENDNALNKLLNYRFDRGELAGHSLGNLILLASTELLGDFYTAVREMNKLLAIRGQVLPATTDTVVLKGVTKTGNECTGELDISAHGSQLQKIWLEPTNASPVPEALNAIDDADLIVLGPGSLFTSILPNILLKQLAQKIIDSTVPIVYVANLLTQPGETDDMNIVAHIDWIVSLLGKVPNYVIANQTYIPKDIYSIYKKNGSNPLYISKREERYLKSMGCKVIYGDYIFINSRQHIRHNTSNLAQAIMAIAEDERLHEWKRSKKI